MIEFRDEFGSKVAFECSRLIMCSICLRAPGVSVSHFGPVPFNYR